MLCTSPFRGNSDFTVGRVECTSYSAHPRAPTTRSFCALRRAETLRALVGVPTEPCQKGLKGQKVLGCRCRAEIGRCGASVGSFEALRRPETLARLRLVIGDSRAGTAITARTAVRENQQNLHAGRPRATAGRPTAKPLVTIQHGFNALRGKQPASSRVEVRR